MKIPVSVELAAATPLTGISILAWINAYSPIILFGMGVVMFTCQFFWRRKEHKAIMEANKRG